ncbi:pre-mRNA cleavage and polyadenylation factor (CPF) complex subunit [Lambiella insularis]|nr:pre-mRNA cleavage and polyadenylation factor (CPF) complex subunit [Lambiella insularis]
MDRDRDYRDGYGGGGSGAYDGGHRRMVGRRPVTDYGSTMVQWMRHRRPRHRGGVALEAERPSPSYIVNMLPPAARLDKAVDTVPAKHLHSSLNKIKHPINVVRWTPEGRRCLTGSSSGEFTLWNGMAFNFETIMQAHDSAVRAAEYSHSEDWLVSADHDGVVKYWQPNFNNVKAIQAHGDPIRDIAFSPNDAKFITACDDATLKIFDFAGGTEESTLSGHSWDAKSVDWHPTKGLIVSGSKDHLVKLWDPRTGRCLTTLHGHKNAISKTVFEPQRGLLLATCARDQTARVFDLRMMRDVCLLRGSEKDISTLTWHPIHVSLLSTGGSDGSILHYLLDEPNLPPGIIPSIPPYDSPDPSNTPAQTLYPAHRIQYAHDFAVWSLDWHPLGHILASGSNDRVTRFWTRPRPGDTQCLNDRYHIGEAAAEAQGTWDRRGGRRIMREEEEQEMEDEAEGLVDQKMPAKQPVLPGLPGIMATPGAVKDGTSTGGAQALQPQLPGVGGFSNSSIPPPVSVAGMSQIEFAALIAEGKIFPPPFVGTGQGIPPPPPNFDLTKLPPGIFPPNFQLPTGFPPIQPPPLQPLPANINGAGLPGVVSDTSSGSGMRRRAPLPSQQESLMMEQQKGKYRISR